MSSITDIKYESFNESLSSMELVGSSSLIQITSSTYVSTGLQCNVTAGKTYRFICYRTHSASGLTSHVRVYGLSSGTQFFELASSEGGGVLRIDNTTFTATQNETVDIQARINSPTLNIHFACILDVSTARLIYLPANTSLSIPFRGYLESYRASIAYDNMLICGRFMQRYDRSEYSVNSMVDSILISNLGSNVNYVTLALKGKRIYFE